MAGTTNKALACDEVNRGKFNNINGVASIDLADDYDHDDSSLEYILENVLYEPPRISGVDVDEYSALQDQFNSIYTSKCVCAEDSCSSKDRCFHGGNYKVAIKAGGLKELVLNENRTCQDLIYECSSICHCSPTCYNRLLQYGPRKNLRVIDVTYDNWKQRGLITTEPVPKGAFVCEYAGEIITKSEAIRRHDMNNATNKMNYILCLNESLVSSSQEGIQTFIDPSERGNIGRYLNHSCDPNCCILSVRTGTPLPRLGIFTKKDISPFEELHFHYGGERREAENTYKNRIRCYCGSKMCEKFLPNFHF